MFAGAYLGVPGFMVALPDQRGDEGVQAKRPMSTMTTLGGRVIAQLGAAQRRTWQVSLPALSPTEASPLLALLHSQPMPYVWLSMWSTRTSILTPDQSAWRAYSYPSASRGSLVELEGGGIAPSLNDPTSPTRSFVLDVPVVQGVKVTASVHARPTAAGGSVTVRITWQDAAGNIVGTNSGSRVCAASGPWTRVAVSAVPPVGAVKCYLVATNHIALAGPAVTYTDQAVDWSPGNGCATAVIDGADLSPLLADGMPGGQLAALSFDVTEVG